MKGRLKLFRNAFWISLQLTTHLQLIQSMSIIDSRYGVLRITHLGTDTILPACLPLLNNLRNFSLESRSFSLLFWTSVSSKVKDALEDTFHSQALVNLALYRIRELPLAVLEGCVALQELSLEFVTFTREDMLEFSEGRWKPTPQERRTQLNSLRVALSDPLLHFLSHWLTTSTCNFDISNLQRLSVSTTMEYYDHGVVGKILQMPRQSTPSTLVFYPVSASSDSASACPHRGGPCVYIPISTFGPSILSPHLRPRNQSKRSRLKAVFCKNSKAQRISTCQRGRLSTLFSPRKFRRFVK
ncbi:hypothetical protein BDZ97DRAFT_89324 [Flammula alnicola]|nr:hypothetical protein BDZ97DRAFT_89324 [Flammula alnicola]